MSTLRGLLLVVIINIILIIIIIRQPIVRLHTTAWAHKSSQLRTESGIDKAIVSCTLIFKACIRRLTWNANNGVEHREALTRRCAKIAGWIAR